MLTEHNAELVASLFVHAGHVMPCLAVCHLHLAKLCFLHLQIAFRGTRAQEYSGDIGLDEIRIRPGGC